MSLILDRRRDGIEILFAGYPENPLDTLILQRVNKQIGALHNVHSLWLVAAIRIIIS
jgi:hypothetical protein